MSSLVTVLMLAGSLVTIAEPARAATASAVAITAATNGDGYWLLYGDGHVETSGSSKWYGNGGADATAIGVRPNGDGYWIAHANGEVRAFGSAPPLADVAHLKLNSGIVAMATTPSGRGYWLVGGDGGIFASGDARFFGSMGATTLVRPVIGIASTPTGNGYWLVARDGGIFSFGDAPFLGSMGGVRLDADVIAMVSSAGTGGGGSGYLMIGADGGIFAFGATKFYGSLGGQGRHDIVGAAPLANGDGYFMATLSGLVYGFGAAKAAAPPTAPTVVGAEARIESEIFARINADRALRGLPSLVWDAELAQTAAAWSDTMAATGFRHSDLGSTLSGLATFHLAAGENIYWGVGPFATTAHAHQTLMDSAGHRKAMLETAYTTGAVGATCVSGKLYVTEQFGHPDYYGPVTSFGARSRLPQVSTATMPNTSC